jgi:hypothetical protein
MSIDVRSRTHSYKLILVFALLFSLRATAADDGADQVSLRVEDLGYDVASKVQALSLASGRLETIERKFDPNFGVLLDEAAFPEEGAVVQFLPASGTLFSFRRDFGKLSREGANQPLEKKAIHSKAVALLQDLGIATLTKGENMISEEDWTPCKSEIVPVESQEEVFDCWCLSKKLSCQGIPSVTSFIYIKVDGQSGKPIQLVYVPVTKIDDLESKISSDTAKEAAAALISRLKRTGMQYTDSRLVVAAPNNEFAREQEPFSWEIFDQRLAWEVKYSLVRRGLEHHVYVYVDAMTGAVIGGR